MSEATDLFFAEHDKRITSIVCKITLWLTLVFPVLFILSLLHIFKITIQELLVLIPFGCICTVMPSILKKLESL